MFCWSLFFLLYFSFWPLWCLFSFDIRILIVPLVSSNSSYTITLDDHRFFFSLFFLVFLCYWVRVAPSLDEEVCRFSFVLLFAIILSVLRWSPLISPNFLPVFWFQTLLYDLNDCYLHNVSSISPIFITMYLLMHNCTPKGLKLYCTA